MEGWGWMLWRLEESPRRSHIGVSPLRGFGGGLNLGAFLKACSAIQRGLEYHQLLLAE